MNRFSANLIFTQTTAAIGIVCSVFLFSMQSYAQTQEYADKTDARAQIIAAVQAYSENIIKSQRVGRIDTTLPHLDPRLRLSYCNTPLEVRNTSTRKKIGKLTLKITCFDDKKWAIHAPLELKAYEQVVVSTQPILRGQTLSANNTAEEEREITFLNQGYFSESKMAIGTIAKRSIPMNKVILPQFVSTPKLVNKGENITIKAMTRGLSIRMAGTALTEGSLGDLIQVKNSKTQRIVEGRISAPGQITINL